MSAAYVSNIVINSGADFTQYFTLDLNLSGYNVYSQLRKYHGSPSSVSFGCTFTPAGQTTVSIGLTSGQTASLKPGRYVYDVLIESSQNIRTRVVEGMALVTEGVTKVS